VIDDHEREIPLGGDPEAVEPHKRGYLAYVWEAVGRAALEQVLGTAEAKARNGMAGALEEDARLTALFLWTLQSSNGNDTHHRDTESTEVEEQEETDDEGSVSSVSPWCKKGFSLVFDVVRRFAQPLGIWTLQSSNGNDTHHRDTESTEVEEQEETDDEGSVSSVSPWCKKGFSLVFDVVRRFAQPLGIQSVADDIESRPGAPLLPGMESFAGPSIKGSRRRKVSVSLSDEAVKSQRGATTLDRVHAAMLMQSSGRTNALRALLAAEHERGPEFLRLANLLSALYPKTSEEKRLVDAMLLAVPR